MSNNDDALIAELVVDDLVSAYGPVSVDTALSLAISELRDPDLRYLTDLYDAIVMRRSILAGQVALRYARQLGRIIENRTC